MNVARIVLGCYSLLTLLVALLLFNFTNSADDAEKLVKAMQPPTAQQLLSWATTAQWISLFVAIFILSVAAMIPNGQAAARKAPKQLVNRLPHPVKRDKHDPHPAGNPDIDLFDLELELEDEASLSTPQKRPCPPSPPLPKRS